MPFGYANRTGRITFSPLFRDLCTASPLPLLRRVTNASANPLLRHRRQAVVRSITANRADSHWRDPAHSAPHIPAPPALQIQFFKYARHEFHIRFPCNHLQKIHVGPLKNGTGTSPLPKSSAVVVMESADSQ